MTLPDTELTVEVTGIAHGGYAVARHEGRVIFVRHAIPGETVRIRVDDSSASAEDARYWYADTVEVLDSSPDRVTPVWSEAGPGGAGGADLAHLTVPAGRKWKQDVLRQQLQRLGGIPEPEVEVIGSDADISPGGIGYRSRIQLTADAQGFLGMMRPRTNTHQRLTSMPLAVPEITDLALWDRTWPVLSRITAVAPSAGSPVVLVNGEPIDIDTLKPTKQRHIFEEARLEPNRNYHYRLAPTGFWQVHREAPTLLLHHVREALTRIAPQGLAGAHVVELYSGAGLFTPLLAEHVTHSGRVSTFEGDAKAAKNAIFNARALPQVSVTHHDLRRGLPVAGKIDAVVVDPPRTGIAKKLMRELNTLAPTHIVLVACDPAALGRDVWRLRDAGYRLDHVVGLDIFPLTHHVEAVASLTRSGN